MKKSLKKAIGLTILTAFCAGAVPALMNSAEAADAYIYATGGEGSTPGTAINWDKMKSKLDTVQTGGVLKITSDKEVHDIFGGFQYKESANAKVWNNTVTIAGATIGYSDEDNIYGDVYGGYAEVYGTGDATANENTVNILANSKVWDDVHGGYAYVYGAGDATTNGNIVLITDNEPDDNVYGGYAYVYGTGDAIASHNIVTVIKGDVNDDDATGGYAYVEGNGNATANYNSLMLNDESEADNNAHGGYAYVEGNGNATANNNILTLNNGSYVEDDNAYGGRAYVSGIGDAIANNNSLTLNNGSYVKDEDAYGGYAYTEDGNANANENIVTVENSTVKDDVYGGYAYTDDGDANANGNEVTIKGSSEVDWWVSGGEACTEDGNANANKNIVTVENSTVNDDVTGGYAKVYYYGDANANENIVTVENSTVNDAVYGGYADTDGGTANANGNEVTIKGSAEVYYYVSGGEAYTDDGNANANNNMVTISGGTLNYEVTGGYAEVYGTGTANANNNTVIISGGILKDNVYGGYANWGSDTDAAEASNNTVIISGEANVSEATLYGGWAGYYYKDDNNEYQHFYTGKTENNTLIVDGWSGSVSGLQYFDDYEFSNIKVTNEPIVIVTESINNIDFNEEQPNWKVGFVGGEEVEVGTKITLIDYSEAATDNETVSSFGIDAEGRTKITATIGVAKEVEGIVSNNYGDNPEEPDTGTPMALMDAQTDDTEKKVIFKATSAPIVATQTNVVGEGSLAEGMMVSNNDLIIQNMALINEKGKYGVETFASIEAYDNDYDTAAGIGVDGWNALVGVGNNAKTNAGDFAWGVFYEKGMGDYELTNKTWTTKGDMEYEGAGIAARLRKDNGFYTEASFRAGKTDNEVSDAMMAYDDMFGYKTDRDYYAFHVGIGKELAIGEGKDFDIYAKYMHTTLGDDSFNVAGDVFKLDDVYSDVLRVGARYTKQADNIFKFYYGAAYEYEFSGEAEGTASGMKLKTADLGGSTVIGEIGVNIVPDGDSKWTLDAAVRAYTGEREGVGGRVSAVYHF